MGPDSGSSGSRIDAAIDFEGIRFSRLGPT